MALSMTDEELKRRIANGTPIKILAELNGCSDQTIRNWMKKNEFTRPDAKPQETLIDTEVNEVLDMLKEHFLVVKDEIDRLEMRIEPLKVKLRIWSKLIKEVEDGKIS